MDSRRWMRGACYNVTCCGEVTEFPLLLNSESKPTTTCASLEYIFSIYCTKKTVSAFSFSPLLPKIPVPLPPALACWRRRSLPYPPLSGCCSAPWSLSQQLDVQSRGAPVSRGTPSRAGGRVRGCTLPWPTLVREMEVAAGPSPRHEVAVLPSPVSATD
jgi:hypothetical protein